jgi:hypothetical protein
MNNALWGNYYKQAIAEEGGGRMDKGTRDFKEL